MPDDFDDQSIEDQTNSNWRRDLEAKARRADELAAENERLKKDVVFTSALAGIDHPGLTYFRDAYKGDLTAEAIRQAAVEAGFAPAGDELPLAPTPSPAQQPPDLAAHQRMAAAAAGAAPPPPFDPIEAITNAQSADEVMAIVEAHGEKYGVISSRLAQ